jgi:hypothetical protein
MGLDKAALAKLTAEKKASEIESRQTFRIYDCFGSEVGRVKCSDIKMIAMALVHYGCCTSDNEAFNVLTKVEAIQFKVHECL